MLEAISKAISALLGLYLLVILVVLTVAGVVVYRYATMIPPSPGELAEVMSTASAWRLASGYVETKPAAAARIGVLALGAGDGQALGRDLAKALAEAAGAEPVSGQPLRELWATVRPDRDESREPSRDELARLTEAAGLDSLFVTRVEKLDTGEAPEMRVSWRRVGAGEDAPTLGQGVIAETPRSARDVPRGEPIRLMPFSVGWSLLIWVGWTILLPIGAAGALMKLLHRESNATTGATLTLLTAANVLLALFLMGFVVVGWFDGLFVIGAALFSGAYNYFVLDRLEGIRI
jgi:hypothetical protein